MPFVDVTYVADSTPPAEAVERYCRSTRDALCDIFAIRPEQVRTVLRRVPTSESYLVLEESAGSMLVVQVTLLDAYSEDQHDQCHERLAQIAADDLGWDLEDVRTWISLVGRHEWGIGGRSFAARLAELSE